MNCALPDMKTQTRAILSPTHPCFYLKLMKFSAQYQYAINSKLMSCWSLEDEIIPFHFILSLYIRPFPATDCGLERDTVFCGAVSCSHKYYSMATFPLFPVLLFP